MRRMKIWKKRTAGGQRWMLSGVVLFFACLWVICIWERKNEDETVWQYDVVKESVAGQERIPLDDYLVGALAASMPENYEAEVYKAQAVLLRTRIIKIAERNNITDIPYGQTGQMYLSDGQMRARWGADYKKHRQKCETAVQDTDRMILQYHGVAAEAPYFALSVGSTRSDGKMTSVSCKEDVLAQDYLDEQVMAKRDFYEQMKLCFATMETINPSAIKLVRDDPGYVEWAEWNGQRVPGEEISLLLGLPSTSFTMEERKDQVIFVTRGIGHGYGMSQYTANLMAQRGEDFYSILCFFFPEYEIAKK